MTDSFWPKYFSWLGSNMPAMKVMIQTLYACKLGQKGQIMLAILITRRPNTDAIWVLKCTKYTCNLKHKTNYLRLQSQIQNELFKLAIYFKGTNYACNIREFRCRNDLDNPIGSHDSLLERSIIELCRKNSSRSVPSTFSSRRSTQSLKSIFIRFGHC